MVKKKTTGIVSVSIGHLAGTSREFKVPAGTTVGELVDALGFKLEGSDRVVDSKADVVETSDKVKAGEDYTISSNLKA
ncbi:MAG: hypothetical protein AABY15_00995, partial [Nanoarchaeota archaeon]